MARTVVGNTQRDTTQHGRPNLALANVIVNSLRHPRDVRDRIRAINAFVKRLRKGDSFQTIWDAAGGAAGIASLMASFSVLEVHRLCRLLGRTASAANAQKERRDGLGELVEVLMRGDFDPRPLGDLYQFIVPACHESFIQAWDGPGVVWTGKQRQRMILGHRRFCEDAFLREIFSRDENDMRRFSQHQMLFQGNSRFCETVLRRLDSLNADEIHVPCDFISEFALPLLKRLSGSKSSRSKQEIRQWLDLVIRCCQKHARHLGNQLSPHDEAGLIRFVTQLWIDDTGKDRKVLKGHVEKLYEITGPMTNLTPWTMYDLIQAPKRGEAFSRYELLCILLRYTTPDGLDLEDDSPATIKKLECLDSRTDRRDMWPADLFLSLPPDKSLTLFLKLKQAHPDGNFIKLPPGRIELTILGQEQAPGSQSGDLDIIETILRRQIQPDDTAWLDQARIAIQARIKAATEASGAGGRGFWIRSAINLCVAAQELEMLANSLRLARRFTNDPNDSMRPWGADFLRAKEFLQLLTVVPDLEESEVTAEKVLRELNPKVGSNMRAAHNVILTLLRTALSAVGGPGFREDKWVQVISLPALIFKRRDKHVRAIQERASALFASTPSASRDIEAAMVEEVWKPIVSQLLEIESVMSAPAVPKTWSMQWQASGGSLGSLMGAFSFRDPMLLADMTRYCLEGVRQQLPQTLARAHMASIAELTIRLANSSQPSLALPFIRAIIQEGDYSVDHRKLLTHKLLASLSADTARDFLWSMIDGATAALRRQNTQTMQVSTHEISSDQVRGPSGSETSTHQKDQVSKPGIKVATIKMIAQLLNKTPAIGPSTSCEMLVSLLKESHHIDARVEITKSLLRTLELQTAKFSLRAMVFEVLEEHVLPLASQLHERRPTTEAEWQCENGKMPEVSEANLLFITLRQGLYRRLLRPDDRAKLTELIFKALEQSAHHNRRWMSTFIEKNGFDKDVVQQLPTAPARFDEFTSMFQEELSRTPDSFLTMLKDMFLVNICPPTPVIAVTRKIKADPSLRTSEEGKHWLKQYDNPGSSAFDLGLYEYLHVLSQMPHEQAESENALQFSNLITNVAKGCIDGNEPEALYCLTDAVARAHMTSREVRGSWTAQAGSILSCIISAVEQAELEGSAVTHHPDIFRLRLDLLELSTWDCCANPKGNSELKIRALAAQIAGLVEYLISRPAWPYHTGFEQLKRRLVRDAGSLPCFVHVATTLGRLHSSHPAKEVSPRDRETTDVQSPLAAYLCLELAAEIFLEKRKDSYGSDSIASVKLLVREWVESEDAVVMKTGARVERYLKELRGWDD